MVINQYSTIDQTSSQLELDPRLRPTLHDLIKKNRLDIIVLLGDRLESVRRFFNNPEWIQQNVNMMTGSATGRRLLEIFIDC